MPALDCGTPDVPLVHGSTDERRMLVDVVVLPGTGDGPHEPLLLNPGGPGGAGTELVRELATPALIDYARTGDLEPVLEFVQMAGDMSGGEENERDEGADDDVVTMERAVLCADDPARPAVDELSATLAGLNEVSDLFAEADIALAASCIGWPASLDPVIPIATAAPASLVNGGSTDALTPIEWAQVSAEAIGGVYLASDHDGHTSVFNGESRCVDDIAPTFLLDGTLPAGASCVTDDGEDPRR